LIKQNYLPQEIIIVDNSYKKEAKKISLDFKKKYQSIKINYLYEKKGGTPFARNKGIKQAENNFLAFIDDDCIAEKNWVKEAFYSLKKYPIVLGKNFYRKKDSIFSIVENIETEAFFDMGKINNKQTIFLDSKNFAVKKEILLKHNIFFDYSFSPYSIFEDIDFGFSFILKSNQFIYFNRKMKVLHQGRNNFKDHIMREIKKSKGYALLLYKYFNKRGVLFEKNQYQKIWLPLLINHLFLKSKYKKRETKLIKKIKVPKLKKLIIIFILIFDHILFKIFFFLKTIDFLIKNYYSKIK